MALIKKNCQGRGKTVYVAPPALLLFFPFSSFLHFLFLRQKSDEQEHSCKRFICVLAIKYGIIQGPQGSIITSFMEVAFGVNCHNYMGLVPFK